MGIFKYFYAFLKEDIFQVLTYRKYRHKSGVAYLRS